MAVAQEVKEKAVLALEHRGSKTVDQVAKKYGVSTTTLHKWRAQLDEQGILRALLAAPEPEPEPEHVKPQNGIGTPGLARKIVEAAEASAEVSRLRAENAELRALLKKVL